MKDCLETYECVAVSSRIRLARNFADYPFPSLMLHDPHAEEMASEIVRLISGELMNIEEFDLFDIGSLTQETAAYLIERNLISRDLASHSRISAALISKDESISVMINEEDHIREQYFVRGYDLKKAYERIEGIDDVISASIPFAYDVVLGYLTACPTNLGTGMRASVMLFLPALSRRGHMRRLSSELSYLGLTVRGTSGEGSGTEGDLFQVSNEITLGLSEDEILNKVENAVKFMVESELLERRRMCVEGGIPLKDKVMRSYGILSNCCQADAKEFSARLADMKLAVALGYLDTEHPDAVLAELDRLWVCLRPANILRLGAHEGEEDIFRAAYFRKQIAKLGLCAR